MRPPTPRLFSNTVGEYPLAFKCFAHVKPHRPAPITAMLVSLDVLDATVSLFLYFPEQYRDLDTYFVRNRFSFGSPVMPLCEPGVGDEKDSFKCTAGRLNSMKRRATLKILAIMLLAVAFPFISERAAIADEAELWAALRSGGHVALLRHAIAPGTGDPDNFVIGDCSTQRNLSDNGRDQAERIGERFRANNIDSTRIFSSQWCRCLDTARGLKLGPARELPPLNSFFQSFEERGPRTRALKEWIKDQDVNRRGILTP